MNYVCHYAIVRFLPFVETGEFANIGLVMYCAQTGVFQFKLLNRTRRITAFFEELDIKVYRLARADFQKELDRISNLFVQNRFISGAAEAKNIFKELVRPREAMLRFDETRVIMTHDPVEQFQLLFEHYVGRSFATKAYQEQLIEKSVREALRSANLSAQFKEKQLGNNIYHARFPFVSVADSQPTCAIKPLHLAHDEPTQIFDHGWEWVGKLHKLKSLGLLPPAVLFAVKGPEEENREHVEAFNEIVEKIRSLHVDVIDHVAVDKIVDFAREKTARNVISH